MCHFILEWLTQIKSKVFSLLTGHLHSSQTDIYGKKRKREREETGCGNYGWL